MVEAEKIILVPETHWDREWYLPFQEFRAELVLMFDKLLEILETNPDYDNFTFDGQTIPIEDYLEVRPENKEIIEKYVKERRLSIGPMYVLPDEFLISGESLIRNLMIGHQFASKFGRVMKAGYIPDPFGHISQLPQILKGFEIPSVIFWRGFGNQFEENNLNIEFRWKAPGEATSILGIHLLLSYGSIANINTKKRNEQYKVALRKINRVVEQMENYTTTPYVLLNNGSDHDEAQPEIPEIISQWNEANPEKEIIQTDFEYYIEKVLESNPELKDFQGELRGGKYAHLLSGVFSARMWIKQRNTAIEYLYEKYTEPLATLTWVLVKNQKDKYPKDYILTGLKWLIKNHPHDSICGCSIDQVHEEMRTRFDWAEQIGEEIIKNSFIHLSKSIEYNYDTNNWIPLIVYNPLPYRRKDVVEFNGITPKKGGEGFPSHFKLIDNTGKEIEYQGYLIKEEPRYTQETNISKHFSFLAELPACGYKTYYLNPDEEPSTIIKKEESYRVIGETFQNEFYQININPKGKINVLDKESGVWYNDICTFEDVGDWGDEYDFSGPKENQFDMKYTTEDAQLIEMQYIVDGPTQKTVKMEMNFKLPVSLTDERYERESFLTDNPLRLYITLYEGIKRIDFRIEMFNNSRDHRFRVLFPSSMKADKVYADGHFHVLERDIDLPDAEDWVQKPLPTNHQKDFVALCANKRVFAVLNKGLPEYEPIKNNDGTITLAITLLRCVEWLSRDDFKTRSSHAGPEMNTPGSQCLGSHIFEFSLVVENDKADWLQANIQKYGKEFNNNLLPIFPTMTDSNIRLLDKVVLKPRGTLSLYLGGDKDMRDGYLSDEMSFIKLDNDAILISAIKKSEKGNNLILRTYNLSDGMENGIINFPDVIKIRDASIVNLLEEEPKNVIKATIEDINNQSIRITLDPHVITTIKIEFERVLE
jgi:mannosylglycerate hydrolase